MPPRRDHGASPDFRFAYKHCRILHFLQKIEKIKSDFYVFTVKVNENGGFCLPRTHFWGPLGEPLALIKCRIASVLLYELHLRMLK